MKTDTGWNKAFAERLRDARIAAGLNQSQAARLAEVSQAYISMAESGDRMIDAPVLSRLCDIYDVNADWMLGLKTEDDLDPEWVSKIQQLSPGPRQKLRKLLSMIQR